MIKAQVPQEFIIPRKDSIHRDSESQTFLTDFFEFGSWRHRQKSRQRKEGYNTQARIIRVWILIFGMLLAANNALAQACTQPDGILTKSVIISQVLYDSTNGLEAIELFNSGQCPIDISDYIIMTSSSPKDAQIPGGIIMPPHSFFLIADEGWNSNISISISSTIFSSKAYNVLNLGYGRSEPSDYEETLTLKNSDSGVALLAPDQSVIDKVGWGLAPLELFEGTAAFPAPKNHSLIRKYLLSSTIILLEDLQLIDSDDNSADFVVAEPFLRSSSNSFFIQENNLTSANNKPENNTTPENSITLERNTTLENIITPENNNIPENSITPENNNIPENSITPENNNIPENSIIPESNTAPENSIIPESNTILENTSSNISCNANNATKTDKPTANIPENDDGPEEFLNSTKSDETAENFSIESDKLEEHLVIQSQEEFCSNASIILSRAKNEIKFTELPETLCVHSDDDSDESGIQLAPIYGQQQIVNFSVMVVAKNFQNASHTYADNLGTDEFDNKTIDSKVIETHQIFNSTEFSIFNISAQINISYFSFPGNYSVRLADSIFIPVEVLPVSAYSIQNKNVNLVGKKGREFLAEFDVVNIGNTNLNFTVNLKDGASIPKSIIRKWPEPFDLRPNNLLQSRTETAVSKKRLSFRFKMSDEINPGTYSDYVILELT